MKKKLSLLLFSLLSFAYVNASESDPYSPFWIHTVPEHITNIHNNKYNNNKILEVYRSICNANQFDLKKIANSNVQDDALEGYDVSRLQASYLRQYDLLNKIEKINLNNQKSRGLMVQYMQEAVNARQIVHAAALSKK